MDDEDRSPKTYPQLKEFYRKRRNAFRNNPDALTELADWKAHKPDLKFVELHGLIPPGKIGTSEGKGLAPFSKCDTFFSEFAAHNPAPLILSASDHSYIIGNNSSYDVRQYPSWFNPEWANFHKTPEGQGFGHALVISRARIYNIVDPAATANKCFLIKEMRTHFITFWNAGGSPALLRRTRSGFDEQNTKLATKTDHKDQYDELFPELQVGFEELASGFGDLKAPDDFEFGFHAFPDMSVGHLHMHVFPKLEDLRRLSTRKHDWKTVPVEAVVEVEAEDGN